MKKTLVLFCLLSILTNAVSCVQYYSDSTPLASSPEVSPKPEDATINVYHSKKDIERPYQKLCLVEGRMLTARQDVSYQTVIDKTVKPEARKCGADAIIIQGSREEDSGDSHIVEAVAVRYTDGEGEISK